MHLRTLMLTALFIFNLSSNGFAETQGRVVFEHPTCKIQVGIIADPTTAADVEIRAIGRLLSSKGYTLDNDQKEGSTPILSLLIETQQIPESKRYHCKVTVKESSTSDDGQLTEQFHFSNEAFEKPTENPKINRMRASYGNMKNAILSADFYPCTQVEEFF